MAETTIGKRRAHGEPDQRAEQGDHHDLDERDGEDASAGRAEALQRRHRGAAAVDIGGDRIGDADAAHDERREPDQRQELREPLDIALELRGGVDARARLEPGIGQPRLQILA